MLQPTSPPATPSCRNAFTLLELCVSIAIVGLLAAIVIPAVSATREAARRTDCQDRLHQVTAAALAFESSHGRYPTASTRGGWATLFPYLELDSLQQALFRTTPSGGRVSINYDPSLYPGLSAEVLTCPSDELANANHGHITYLMNNGTRVEEQPWNGLPAQTRDITDGLSNTAAFAEHLIQYRAAWHYIDEELFAYPSEYDPMTIGPIRFTWYLDGTPATAEDFHDLCQAAPALYHPIRYKDYIGWSGSHGYKHLMEPNTRSCYPGRIDDDPLRVSNYNSSASVVASSRHPGCVNVGMCDGHLRVVGDSVDISVWRAAGTISGHEAVAPLP